MTRATSAGVVAVAITGTGGAGVMTAGEVLLRAAASAGYFGIMSRSSGPQIRGGEAAAFVRLAAHSLEGPGDRLDILFAMDWLNIGRFESELPLDGSSLVVYDDANVGVPEFIRATGARLVPLPLKQIVKSIPGGRANVVVVGFIAALLGFDERPVLAAVSSRFSTTDDAVAASNVASVRAGAEAAQDAGFVDAPPRISADSNEGGGRWVISGNEAVGFGALSAGVRFAAAYPITPATEILEWMAPRLERLGGTLVQAEDELASINMIIGSSFGGVASMTATSGPGLSLMTESIGLAIASETPVVVVDVMRGGPSTGIPAKSEQSDLGIALHGLHGDAPHIVTAPISIADCVATTAWTVELAERLQTAAIILSDQALGQSRAIIDVPDENRYFARRETAQPGSNPYLRYAATNDGVSPMAIPGTAGGEYVAEGLEHTEQGRPSSDADIHTMQLEKRQRKLSGYAYGPFWAHFEGEGEIAILTWGSTTGAAREARVRLAQVGVRTRLISLRLLMPAQVDALHQALDGVARALVVEQSFSRQFHQYLLANYRLPQEQRLLNRAGPLPIRPAEICQCITTWD